jgi:hypothetical protein
MRAIIHRLLGSQETGLVIVVALVSITLTLLVRRSSRSPDG